MAYIYVASWLYACVRDTRALADFHVFQGEVEDVVQGVIWLPSTAGDPYPGSRLLLAYHAGDLRIVPLGVYETRRPDPDLGERVYRGANCIASVFNPDLISSVNHAERGQSVGNKRGNGYPNVRHFLTVRRVRAYGNPATAAPHELPSVGTFGYAPLHRSHEPLATFCEAHLIDPILPSEFWPERH